MPLYDYRAAPYTAKDPTVVDIVTLPLRYVPLLLWSIERQKDRGDWTSETDWSQGYTHLCAVQWELLMGSRLDELLESNRQIYRLLDTSINGATYMAGPPDPVTGERAITPAIPLVPASPLPSHLPAPALRKRLERLINLVDNQTTGRVVDEFELSLSQGALLDNQGQRQTIRAMQGVINAGWFGIGGQQATLADVVEALRIGSPADAERIDTALEALSAASSTANVFGVVRQLLADVVDTGLEGATLGTLIAASIANAATQGVISGQLDKLLVALTGFVSGDTNGNPLIPTMIWQAQNTRARIQQDAETLTARLDSILLKLDNLNLNNDELTPYIDQVEELLGDIRTLLQ